MLGVDIGPREAETFGPQRLRSLAVYDLALDGAGARGYRALRNWSTAFPIEGIVMAGDYRILVAIDLKTGTDRLLAEAQRYGQAFNATVSILHVVEPDPTFVGYLKADDLEEQDKVDPVRDPHAEALRAEHRQAQFCGAILHNNGVRVGHTLTIQGPPATIILQEVRKLDSDLLILGSHHHNALYRFWCGDTKTTIAAQPPCALLVIPVLN